MQLIEEVELSEPELTQIRELLRNPSMVKYLQGLAVSATKMLVEMPLVAQKIKTEDAMQLAIHHAYIQGTYSTLDTLLQLGQSTATPTKE
jgi:hypothetical protein